MKMNGIDKYEELEESIKNKKTAKEKVDQLTVMVCMMAKNDIYHLWDRLGNVKKLVWIVLAIGIFSAIRPEGWDVTALIRILAGMF